MKKGFMGNTFRSQTQMGQRIERVMTCLPLIKYSSKMGVVTDQQLGPASQEELKGK